MAVKIRLTRRGKKKQPTYRVVVADSRAPRDGRYIEQIGRYDPRPDPSVVEVDNDRARYWLGQGAQPSDAVRRLLEISGVLEATRVRTAKVHVVDEQAQLAAAAEEVEMAETIESPEEAAAEVVEEAVDATESVVEEVAETAENAVEEAATDAETEVADDLVEETADGVDAKGDEA
jgi:small subunit ribosomal protein S16